MDRQIVMYPDAGIVDLRGREGNSSGEKDAEKRVQIDGDIEQYEEQEESDFGTEEPEEDKKKDGIQEFLSKIRLYNRQGPHLIYERVDQERKIKEPRRLIRKSGKYNVSRHEESEIWDKYLRDFCNTLVHSRWRWTIIASSASFILSWLLFALIWMLIANANGDHEMQSDSLKCFFGVKSFAGFFLLSLETQATIGYGSRSLNDQCPEVVFVLCLQIILGVGITGLMVNIVYIKMTKSQHIYSKLFSKQAVICRRDGDLCLIFRVRDEDSRHAIGTTITAYVLRKDKESGEPYLETIPLEPHGFLIWPLEIVHKITSTSPLWDVSSYNLLSDKFEVIVTLQGTSPTTAQCSRTRTSYTSSEILWGHKFKNCLKYVKKENSYVVNQRHFNSTEEHSTHLCSAKRFIEVYSTLTPTPTFRNYEFKINIMYTGGQRRGTVTSIKTVDKGDDQSLRSSKEEKSNRHEEKGKEQRKPKPLPRSVLNSSSNDSNKNVISSTKEEVSKPEITTELYDNLPGNNGKQWESNFSETETHFPDFWMKQAASLPLINNYNQEPTLKPRKFGSDLQPLLANGGSNFQSSNGSKSLLTPQRVFDGEDMYYNSTSADDSNVSLLSDHRKCDLDPEMELNAMLKTMESYLELNFIDCHSRSSSPFPK